MKKDTVWICRTCHLIFGFQSDIKSHRLLTGHRNISEYDLPALDSFRDAEHV